MKKIEIRRQTLTAEGTLTQEQILDYRYEGYLFFPGLLTREAVDRIKQGTVEAMNKFREGVILEKDNVSVRSHFGGNRVSPILHELTADTRLVKPIRALLEDDVYVHQFKINRKAAFSENMWTWHQDSPAWILDDGMPEPKALTAMVCLTEVNSVNGPLFVLPGSHRLGVFDEGFLEKGKSPSGDWKANLVAYMKYPLTRQRVDLLSTLGTGIIEGEVGSVLFFDCNLVHSSPCNLSSQDRDCIFITYNGYRNRLREVSNPRPAFIAERNHKILQ